MPRKLTTEDRLQRDLDEIDAEIQKNAQKGEELRRQRTRLVNAQKALGEDTQQQGHSGA